LIVFDLFLETFMAVSIYWLFLALILVALEMMTGTFYLLMVAIAMAFGGLFSLFGFPFSMQLILASLAGLFGVGFLRYKRNEQRGDPINQSLDIGQSVERVTRQEGGRVRVFYRGAEWDAELETMNTSCEGTLYIKDIRGSVLILTNRKQA
jgi:membrane protein implicated in regulation of membrane protease activity